MTIETKHTPGPWHTGPTWRPEAPQLVIYAPANGDARIAEVEITYDGREDANARLIAAAPELLEVCQLTLEAVLNVPSVGEVYDQQHSDTHMAAFIALRAAIAKATGEAK